MHAFNLQRQHGTESAKRWQLLQARYEKLSRQRSSTMNADTPEP